jgi:hypothetical protein
MKGSKINKEWHDSHGMPSNPTRAQRIEWHAEHAAACGCRPIPQSLSAEVKALGGKKPLRAN